MKKPWYYDLLGTAYVRGGMDPATGLDCFGLLLEAYRRKEAPLDLPEFDYEGDWRRRALGYLVDHAPRLFKPAERPFCELDVLVTEPDGENEPLHVSVFVDYAHVLHTTRKTGVHVARVRQLAKTTREVLRAR